VDLFVMKVSASGTFVSASQIAIDGGNNQTTAVNTAVATRPSVVVRDANDIPVQGVTVTFAVVSGGGSVTGAVATTNALGIATVGGWTVGPTVGANTLTAIATGVAGSLVTFTATGTPAPAPAPGPAPAPAPAPGSSVAPPASVSSGSVPGAVMENGVVRTDVVLTETSTGSGWEVVGPDFSMVANTETGDRSPMQLLPDGSMQVPQGGFLEFGGTGFAPNSEVAMFAIPVTGPRFIARVMARSINDAVYLGSAVTSSSGSVSAQFTIPTDMAIGDYVWQINGVSPTNQLRSVNFSLVVVPTTRAGLVRQAAFYQGKSAKLSRLGRAKLRGLVAEVPKDAEDVRVSIVGVSISLSTTSQNLTLARDRAEAIATFLTRRGVAGEYTVSVTTTFTVRDAERSSRAVAGDTSPTSLDQPLKSKRGKPLTTATISFKAPASSAR